MDDLLLFVEVVTSALSVFLVGYLVGQRDGDRDAYRRYRDELLAREKKDAELSALARRGKLERRRR